MTKKNTANEKPNPFLKKPNVAKPPTRKEIRRGLGRRLDNLNLLSPAPMAGSVEQVAPTAAPVASAQTVLPPPPSAPKPDGSALVEIPPLDIERSPWQPRADFNEDALKELADSIQSNGVIQPLVVRRRTDGKYELIAGERRLRASVIAGLKKVPAVLVDAHDQKAAEWTLIENIQRRDLNVIEEAEGYRLLLDKFDLTQENLSERIGKSRPSIANALRLLELPDEVKQLLTQNLISTGHAKVLLSEEDEKMRILDARAIVNEGLTVRALESRIAKRNVPVAPMRRGTPDMSDNYVRTLTDAIRRHTGCAVRLKSGITHANGKCSKGLLEIDFIDNDDLDRLLSIIGVKID
ncbi:MAG: ParB/RepB/Spo0J family partition protein [Kiritimatiellae bacterium]|nr:ParB/RepB/Spo0J family partition protein [Kiritimatiellia bacterium]